MEGIEKKTDEGAERVVGGEGERAREFEMDAGNFVEMRLTRISQPSQFNSSFASISNVCFR